MWGTKVEACEKNLGSVTGWINFSCGRISARRTQSDDSTERGTDFTSLLKPACGMIVEEILRKHLCKQKETITSWFVFWGKKLKQATFWTMTLILISWCWKQIALCWNTKIWTDKQRVCQHCSGGRITQNSWRKILALNFCICALYLYLLSVFNTSYSGSYCPKELT